MPRPWEKRPPKAPKPKAKAPSKSITSAASQDKTTGGDELGDAVAKLQSSMARAEAEKLENSYEILARTDSESETNVHRSARLVDGTLMGTKGGKVKAGAKSRLLSSQPSSNPRSLPGSPALSGLGSPSLAPTSGSAASQEKAKQQRFPIIHELAVEDQPYDVLVSKFDDSTVGGDFSAVLNKVADFDEKLQKWVMKKLYWKELDVYEYDYDTDEDRQKAIDNSIKQFDRMRLGASDPLWQKLLPKSERGKGICLSKLQAAMAKGPVASAPKINLQKPDGSSGSGGDSEREDSSGGKKGKGGDAMARSGSGQGKKKTSAAEAQQKRLLGNPKKAAAPPATRPSPKVSPTKPAPPKKAAAAAATTSKGGRGALSKEFVSDSSSDDETVPLATSVPKMRAALQKAKATAMEKEKEKEKPKESAAPKPKPAPRQVSKETAKEKDTIRAQVVAKPLKAAKRPRDEEEDDDSSSSGTPLSKRFKPKPLAAPKASAQKTVRHRTTSDVSQHSRGSSGASFTKSKNTSPIKSSPLASSPPTNASDQDREHDTIVSSGLGAKKRKVEERGGESKKRQKLSPEILNKANKFKQFYVRYEALHKKLMALDDPPDHKMADLLDMHERLTKMKSEIYREVTADGR